MSFRGYDLNIIAHGRQYEIKQIRKILDHTDGCNKLVIRLNLDTDEIHELDGQTIDITKFFPGYEIKAEQIIKKRYRN